MHPQFWHERWQRQQIGFHEPEVNPLLVHHHDALRLARGARVFVPLCGKTLDIDWLLSRGHAVVATELSPIAVTALFGRLGVEPAVEDAGNGPQRWHGGRLEVFVGDHFQVPLQRLGHVDAVYDRAALIALPAAMRPAYARHMQQLAPRAPQLLVTLEYEQSRLDGPPFSVDEAELRILYPAHTLRRLASGAIDGGLKGKVPASENVWLLGPPRGA
ncbi:MAG: thiopurine S-methyltransferase [Pseudomonadota bacterium]|jgi:thiopurine S-methyltransferase|nr:MAG: thiopurine S-methyltransferase [Pseudomonadota bacterium]